MRSAGADGAAKIAPKINFSLEESMEYIKDDEYLEVTPQSLRMKSNSIFTIEARALYFFYSFTSNENSSIGGAAGFMAAITAKEHEPKANVVF